MKQRAMIDRTIDSVVAEFLRDALAVDVLGVPKLEAMARAAGLLGEHQRITNAKAFKRAKKSLGIKSVRAGFGTGGEWLWKLPNGHDEALATPSISHQPPRTERRVPVDWAEGVG